MSDITISYKGSSIATMDASGTKTLLTEGKYCEDDITLQYVKPSGGGTGYYHLTADSIYQLFDQYATENGMTKMDLTFASDQTDYFTVQHTLGKVPTEVLLYPKNCELSGSHYQMGWATNSLFGMDRAGNRTYMFRVGYAPNPNVIWYPNNKNIMTFSSVIFMTDYNFTRSVPTSTEIELRGGSASYVKLKAGEYVLALK